MTGPLKLNRLCRDASDSELRALPQFAKFIEEYIEDLRDPTNGAARTLYLLDFYCYDAAAFEQHKSDQLRTAQKLGQYLPVFG